MFVYRKTRRDLQCTYTQYVYLKLLWCRAVYYDIYYSYVHACIRPCLRCIALPPGPFDYNVLKLLYIIMCTPRNNIVYIIIPTRRKKVYSPFFQYNDVTRARPTDRRTSGYMYKTVTSAVGTHTHLPIYHNIIDDHKNVYKLTNACELQRRQ